MAELATNVIDYLITITTQDTEYSQVIPYAVKAIEIDTVDGTAVRTSFETGKVATPTPPYITVRANTTYRMIDLYLNKPTLYVACASGTKVAQVRVWY